MVTAVAADHPRHVVDDRERPVGDRQVVVEETLIELAERQAIEDAYAPVVLFERFREWSHERAERELREGG